MESSLKTIALAGLIFSSSVANHLTSLPPTYAEDLKSYLHHRSFQVTGKFYMYDFDGDKSIDSDEWVYIDASSGQPFRLMGEEPSDDNPFGWAFLGSVPPGLDIQKPDGYFIFIDYPKDREILGTDAFSWLYLSQGSTYKLMGAVNNRFYYLDEDGDGVADPLSGITYNFDGTYFTFSYNKPQSLPPTLISQEIKPVRKPAGAKGCKISSNTSYNGVQYTYRVEGWYKGNIIHECRENLWELKSTPFTITQIIKTVKSDMKIDNKRIKGISIYDYKHGIVYYKGVFWDREVDCYTYYTPQLPTTLSLFPSLRLEEIMEWEGDGPCDPDFISTTCPSWFYEDRECSSGENSSLNEEIAKARHVEIKSETSWKVTDNEGKLHQVFMKQYIRILNPHQGKELP